MPKVLTRAAVSIDDGMILLDYPGPKGQLQRRGGKTEYFCDTPGLLRAMRDPARARGVAGAFVQAFDGRAWDSYPDGWVPIETPHYVIGSDRMGAMGSTIVPFVEREAAQAGLAGLRVSAHFFIRRDGRLVQFVPIQRRAWHAGVSVFEGRERCNEYSIGVELEGVDDLPYTSFQYAALTRVTQQIMLRYPDITRERIVGHSDIAPGRKTDPGPAFGWQRYLSGL
jgi:nitrous oxide reductase accessory protein NosL